MPSQPDLFPQDPQIKQADQRADLEWLLCLASAVQASDGLAALSARTAMSQAAPAGSAKDAVLGTARANWRQALRRLLGRPEGGGRKRPAA